MSVCSWFKDLFKSSAPKWTVDHTKWCGPLKDQGDTMECTAYAVTSCMEWWARKNGKPVNFDPRAAFARQGSANTSLALINAYARGIGGYRIEDYVELQVDSIRQELEKAPIICDMLISPLFKSGYSQWERHAVLAVACNNKSILFQNSWPAGLEEFTWQEFFDSKPQAYRITGIRRM